MKRLALVPLLLLAPLLTACTPGVHLASSKGDATVVDPGQSTPYRGVEIGNGTTLPDTVLTDTGGQVFVPAKHDDHPVTLLFTGYTSCPDVCPTTMAAVASALRELPGSIRSAVQVEFVSTDPKRDTLSKIRRWLDGFDSAFTGLRGTHAQVAGLSQELGLPVPEDNGTTHSSELLGFVKGKGLTLAWLGDVSPSDLEHDLPLLVKQGA